MKSAFNGLFHGVDIVRSNSVSPAGESPQPDIFDQLPEGRSIEQTITEDHVVFRLIQDKREGDSVSVFLNEIFHDRTGSMALRFLFKIFLTFGKREVLIDLSDKTSEVNSMDGTHQVSDILEWDPIALPCGLIDRIGLLCGPDYPLAEIAGEEEVLVEQEHIGLDIEKTEDDSSMTQRVKFEGHLFALLA